jgi:hypothetical protein
MLYRAHDKLFVADIQILAVVRFFQDREAKGTENGEDEVWEKMGHAGPTHPPQTPTPPADMSREHSREALPQMANFAHPVCPLPLACVDGS